MAYIPNIFDLINQFQHSFDPSRSGLAEFTFRNFCQITGDFNFHPVNDLLIVFNSLIQVLVFFFILISTTYAQPRLELQLAPALSFAQIVYVSDFDFYQQGANQFLFQLTVDNSAGSQTSGILRFEIRRNDDLIAETETRLFTLSAGESFAVSNIELNAGYTTQSGDLIRFDKSKTTNPDPAFEDEVLSSGKLPKGNYQFLVKYLYGTDETTAPPQSIYINNPTFIRPVTPGTPRSSNYLEILYTQFPTFQFETDFDPTFAVEAPFHVQIFKKLEQHGSFDEVLTSTPHYDEWMYETLFPYQVAGVQPLDPGVYVWRVQLRVVTSSGTETLESPLYTFRIEDPSKLGQFDDQGVKDEIMQLLIDLLGERGREIARALSDYNLTAIRLNGETITKTQLYNVLDSYEGQLREISDIVLKGTQQ